MPKDNDKMFNRLKIERKITIKIITIAVFVLILSFLLNVKPGVNTTISFAYYVISILGLFILYYKYINSLGINISDDKINSCFNFADFLSVFVIACTIFQVVFIYF